MINKAILTMFFHICLVKAIKNPLFLDESYSSGFIKGRQNSEMFYWHFESRSTPSTDPLLIWLSGGPGSSSLTNLFLENGPFKIQEDLTLRKNMYSWNNKANLIFVDQPLGTGFSNTEEEIIPQNLDQVAADFWEFLTGFYDIHPQYKYRKLFIAGQSFAGNYIPAISLKIISKKLDFINLAGIMIGNGLVDAFWQFPEYLSFAYENSIIDFNKFSELSNLFDKCQELITEGVDLEKISSECWKQLKIFDLFLIRKNMSIYDIRKQCIEPDDCLKIPEINSFLKKQEVIQALGVENKIWSHLSFGVYEKLINQIFVACSESIVKILQQSIQVLIYSGDQDFISNWKGGEKWTNELDWEKKLEFKMIDYSQWKEYGVFKTIENFTFMRVFQAGHFVGEDQPEAALEMIEKFMSRISFKDLR